MKTVLKYTSLVMHGAETDRSSRGIWAAGTQMEIPAFLPRRGTLWGPDGAPETWTQEGSHRRPGFPNQLWFPGPGPRLTCLPTLAVFWPPPGGSSPGGSSAAGLAALLVPENRSFDPPFQ